MKKEPHTLRDIEDAYVQKQRLNERQRKILCFLFARKGEAAIEDVLRELEISGPWRRRPVEQLIKKHLIGDVNGCIRLTYAGTFVVGVLVRRQSQRKA